MPRKTGQYALSIQLSDRQREILKYIAADEFMATYVRGLIAKEAQRIGFEWPEDIDHVTPTKLGGTNT